MGPSGVKSTEHSFQLWENKAEATTVTMHCHHSCVHLTYVSSGGSKVTG